MMMRLPKLKRIGRLGEGETINDKTTKKGFKGNKPLSLRFFARLCNFRLSESQGEG